MWVQLAQAKYDDILHSQPNFCASRIAQLVERLLLIRQLVLYILTARPQEVRGRELD